MAVLDASLKIEILFIRFAKISCLGLKVLFCCFTEENKKRSPGSVSIKDRSQEEEQKNGETTKCGWVVGRALVLGLPTTLAYGRAGVCYACSR